MSSSSPAGPAAPVPAPTASRRRPLLLALAVVAVVAGVAYGLHWWTVGRFIESTDDAYLKADGVTVAPKVGGYVTDVYVVANQRVKRGDPLVRLDQRQYQAALDQSQAAIDGRLADIERVQADTLQQQAQLAQARAQADLSRINLAHARDAYVRYEPLAVTGATTDEHLSDLRTSRDQAAANLAASQAAVDAVQGQLKASQAQAAQSRAQVKAAEATLRQNHLDVNDTVVRAAIDGRVGDSTVQVGQLVQPGTRLMTVVPTQDIYLVANFKETQIARMRAGQPAALHVDALPDADLQGSVDSFSPGTGAQFALLPAENATGNFTKIVQRVPVRIRVLADPALRERLLPGLSVTVDVDTRGDGRGAAPAAAPASVPDARHG
jgi:membrane fusion protein (multidrug efflux system)